MDNRIFISKHIVNINLAETLEYHPRILGIKYPDIELNVYKQICEVIVDIKKKNIYVKYTLNRKNMYFM